MSRVLVCIRAVGFLPVRARSMMRCSKAWLMMRALSMAGLMLVSSGSCGQELHTAIEQSLEQQAATEEGADTEDDGLWQQWEYLRRHRLNINQADETALLHLLNLTPMQAANFILYRSKFGALVDIMEIQAVPGFDLETIRRILPYVQVLTASQAMPLLRERVRKGEHLVLLRSGAAWDMMPRGSREDGDDAFTGSRASLLLRYTYRFRSLLQWGFTMEKDAGEKLFPSGWGRGMDFFTAHLALRQVGYVRALVLGDFHVNLGQGLIHWQSMAFRKGASGVLVHRQGERIRAYNGMDENRFHRGIALDLGFKKTGLALFASSDRMDGNRVAADSAARGYMISSLQWSGLHRTPAERAGKNVLTQRFLGGSLYWNDGHWRIAWNALGYWFSHQLAGGTEPYRQQGITGKQWMNHSLDYGGYTRNMYIFGELAQARNGRIGFLQGMMLSIDPKMDLAFVYRHLQPGYNAPQANAFTEQSTPGNENGFYAALSLRPAYSWTIQAWIDLYRFPWLRYRVHRPSTGREMQVNLLWKPNRQLEISQRFLSALREINPSGGLQGIPEPVARLQNQYRIQFSFHPNRFILVRHRVDLNAVRFPGRIERGILLSADLTAQAPKRPVSMSARVSWFQADSYEARLYQFERDVLYYYAISPFYRQGLRFYLVLETGFSGNWTAWVKVSSTLFSDYQQFMNPLGGEDPMAKAGIRVQLRCRL